VTVKDLSQEERAALNDLGVVGVLRKEPSVGATASQIIEATVRRNGVAAVEGLAA
jgi:hypothetical protein